jgi:hypothetical protein
MDAIQKDGPYLRMVLETIRDEGLYSGFWMNDGVPQPTYPTFEEFCTEEVHPFVGALVKFRNRYLRNEV